MKEVREGLSMEDTIEEISMDIAQQDAELSRAQVNCGDETSLTAFGTVEIKDCNNKTMADHRALAAEVLKNAKALAEYHCSTLDGCPDPMITRFEVLSISCVNGKYSSAVKFWYKCLLTV